MINVKCLLALSIIISLTVGLSACSSKTQLHFYASNLSKEKIKEVITTIDNDHYNIKVNYLPFPNDINDNAIVYAPSLNSQEVINPLITSLSKIGFDISTASLISANNHSFTENNIGLFLLPDNYVQPPITDKRFEYTIPLVNEYGSTDCQHATTLYLKEPNEFLLEINRWNEKTDAYIEEFIEGQWVLLTNKVLQLNHSSWQTPLKFEKRHFERNEIDGSSKGVKFIPIDDVNFETDQKAIHCTYSISLAV
ncbi:hypothetical protein AADZ91_10945 [Colwelliaceae bacterium 6441]